MQNSPFTLESRALLLDLAEDSSKTNWPSVYIASFLIIVTVNCNHLSVNAHVAFPKGYEHRNPCMSSLAIEVTGIR